MRAIPMEQGRTGAEFLARGEAAPRAVCASPVLGIRLGATSAVLLVMACRSSPPSVATPAAPPAARGPAAAAQPAPTACEHRLVTFDRRPYASPESHLDLPIAGGGHLRYFGAAHSADPAHPQFAEIEAEWRRLRPTVAMYEGPARGEASTSDETIRQFGESGFVRFLARRDGVRIERLEPDPREEAAYILQRFPIEQVKLFYVLREVARLRERRGLLEPQLRAAAAQLLDASAAMFPEFADVIPQVADLDAAYRRHWSEPAHWWEAPGRWFDPGRRSAETGGLFTNEIHRASSEFRDRHMYRAITRQVRRGERVLAVVGRDHVVAQAPALRCALAAW